MNELNRILDAVSKDGPEAKNIESLDPVAKARLAEMQELEAKLVQIPPSAESESNGNVDINRLLQRLNSEHDSMPTDDQNAFTPGDSFGAYQIVRELGRGGMGTVYEAVQTHLGKRVAVKVISPHVLSDPNAIARFRREMKAAGQVDHGNVVRAMDAGEIKGTLYLVTEFVSGVDLSKLVRERGPFPPSEAIRIIRQAASALQAAHASGITHRDVKPSNLVLTEDGQVKLLDLGLARVSNERSSEVTATGAIFGTPDYMSPEQWNDPKSLDHRTDIYSLGCTLYFLLTGQPPFVSEKYSNTYSKMRAHIEEPLPDITTLSSEAKLTITDLLHRMTAKEPSNRFASAQDLVNHIDSMKGFCGESLASARTTVASETPTTLLTEKQLQDFASRKGPSQSTSLHRTSVGKKWLILSSVAVLSLLAGWLVLSSQKERTLVEEQETQQRLSSATSQPLDFSSIKDPDRAVAEWVLSKGGYVILAPGYKTVKTPAEIPSDTFSIIHINLVGITNFSPQEFAIIGQLMSLSGIEAYDSAINDKCLAELAKANPDHLVLLHLTRCNITDNGVKSLFGFKNLRKLVFLDTKITDLELFNQFPNLVDLTLGHCSIDVNKAIDISFLSRLKHLNINADVAIELFKRSPSMFSQLDLFEINKLNQVLPEGLLLNSSALTDLHLLDANRVPIEVALKEAAQLKALTNLTVLGDSENPMIDYSVSAGDFPSLKLLDITHAVPSREFLASLVDKVATLEQLRIAYCPLDDAQLSGLNNAANLKELKLVGVTVTLEAVTELARRLPACKIYLDDKLITVTDTTKQPAANIRNDEQRIALDWILSVGGSAQVVPGWNRIRTTSEIPHAPFISVKRSATRTRLADRRNL
jgi:serine/threonine protein kinase